MRFKTIKMLVAGSVFCALTFVAGISVHASTLDTEIPCAGMSVALSNYKEAVKNPETQIVGLLPDKLEAVEPARQEIFNNMAIAFVDNYVNVRKKPTTESKIVGKIYSNCSATIIEETKDGWYKIESGNVTGYIKAEYFLTGADAEEYAIDMGYVLATVNEAGLRVREHAGTDQKIVTNVYVNEVYAVTKYKKSGEWAKLAIGEGVSGWVSAQYISMSVNMDTAITLKEEQEMIEAELARQAAEEAARQEAAQQQAAQQQQQSSSNNSSSNSNTSAPKPSTNVSYDSATAANVVAYAKQFLGNPYVYGGSSLTNGTDCSGFTMSVYAHFGYSINRSSYSQIYNGTNVSLDSVQPGDLIFYTNGTNRIGHVALYIGGGQIIHASTSETGIIISDMYYNPPYAATRILD